MHVLTVLIGVRRGLQSLHEERSETGEGWTEMWSSGPMQGLTNMESCFQKQSTVKKGFSDNVLRPGSTLYGLF
jgi:hypothetical protein